MKEPFYVSLRDTVIARIKSGELTEDTDLSEALDSLDRVELEMELDELGAQPSVSINSVGDLLWLFKSIDLKRRSSDSSRDRREFQMWATILLLGPVSGATPGLGNPVFNFVVGGVFTTAVWVQYFKREHATKRQIRTAIYLSVIGAFFIALGVWGLVFPR